MKKMVSFENILVENAQIERVDDALRVKIAKGNAVLTLPEMTGDFYGNAKYFVLDVLPHVDYCESVQLHLYEKSGRKIHMHIRLFPGVVGRIVFRLDLMDGSLLFPPLTPGTMKSEIRGQGIVMADVEKTELHIVEPRQENRVFDILGGWLCDELPEFPKAEKTTVDVLGQWKEKEWPGKAHSVEEMKQALLADEAAADEPIPGWNAYGGCTDKQFEATGWFRTQKDCDRWYLVDPEGCAFFSSGVFGVYPGEPGWILGVEDHMDELPDPSGAFAPAYDHAGDLELYRRKFSGMFPDETLLYAPATGNLIRAFGDEWYDRWAKLTARRLRRWGINTLSMFSDPEFIKRSKIPYVIMLKGYPVTKKTIFREFPDVFSREYDDLSRNFASQLKDYADDPLLIGYFLNNEPTWGFVTDILLAEKMLEDAPETASCEAFIQWISERYNGDVAAFNAAWKQELTCFEDLKKGLFRPAERSQTAWNDLMDFTMIMVDMYAGIPAKYAREYAPHHLNLGMRFAHAEGNASLLRTAQHFDVFSLNCYQADPVDKLDGLHKDLDMPILVGEFHFGALDAGLPHPSLFWVKNQYERGKAYERYQTRTAAHECGVGSHYFAYNDQPVWGRYDGENYQFGFVDVCNKPYEVFTEALRRTNEKIYDVMQGHIPPEGGETQRL
ncbi:MAG: hypothetical protein IJ354_11055 [Clostridia bacterium]|nr:hypothetical protein [Clostridia bacterium]